MRLMMGRMLSCGLVVVLVGAILLIAAPAEGAGGSVAVRTKGEVEKLIEEAGKTPPAWWDSVQLNFPNTLDLSWKKTPKKWENTRTMDAYLWDMIYPNPGKWREGVKLAMHSINVNKGNEVIKRKAAGVLADMYTQMLQDYARGAYWAKQAGENEIYRFELVECYWKLGCKEAAVELLNNMGRDDTFNAVSVKLWGEMGELKTALAWAEDIAEDGRAVAAYLSAAQACRRNNDIPTAIKYYNQCIAAAGNPNDRNRKRAQDDLEVIKMYDLLDLNKIKDGTYKNTSQGYVGPIEVAVTVQGHKITEVKVTNHKEKQFYASLTEVPPQIVAKQSVKGIDMTTGATITSEAIVNATAKALAGASR